MQKLKTLEGAGLSGVFSIMQAETVVIVAGK